MRVHVLAGVLAEKVGVLGAEDLAAVLCALSALRARIPPGLAEALLQGLETKLSLLSHAQLCEVAAAMAGLGLQPSPRWSLVGAGSCRSPASHMPWPAQVCGLIRRHDPYAWLRGGQPCFANVRPFAIMLKGAFKYADVACRCSARRPALASPTSAGRSRRAWPKGEAQNMDGCRPGCAFRGQILSSLLLPEACLVICRCISVACHQIPCRSTSNLQLISTYPCSPCSAVALRALEVLPDAGRAWLSELLQATYSGLHAMSSASLGDLLWALSMAGHRPHPRWWARAMACVQQHVAAAQGSGLPA